MMTESMESITSEPTAEELPRQRVRILYEKGEAVKFLSNSDEARLWERTLRRADLPLLYKNGFNPQPHIQFTAPLGVGITGVNEPLDLSFSPPVPLDELRTRIDAALPPGVRIQTMQEVPFKADALQSFLIGSDYTILIFAEPDEIPVERITAGIARFWETPVIVRVRERKGSRYRYNLRPLVCELRYEGYAVSSEEHRIFLRVHQRPAATGRPDEVVDALGFDAYARTLRRERIYYSNDADDVRLFAQYPLADRSEVVLDEEKPQRGRKGQRNRGKRPPSGRTISERAGDEFG